MKYTYLALLLIAAMLALAGCAASPAQVDGLIRTVEAATSDGVVTPDEIQLIIAQLPKPSFDWVQAVQVGGGVLGSILGVKLLPDRLLRSPFESKGGPQTLPPQS